MDDTGGTSHGAAMKREVHAGKPQRGDGELVARVRDFVTKVVAPRSLELDAEPDPARSFAWEIFDEAHARGLRTLAVSPALGGFGAGLTTLTRVFIELAKGDLGVAAVLAQLNGTSALLERVATPQQLDRYLPKLVADPRFMVAVASTEPEVGSDASFPVTGPTMARYRTRAVPGDGGWWLNGHKQFIDNGAFARLYLVLAQTDDRAPLHEGSTCFLVDEGTPGLRPGRTHDKMGQRLAAHAEVFLDDCWVPADHVLGGLNGGSGVFAGFKASRSLLTAACALGVAEAAYERTMRWVQTRVQGGRLLIEHDPIRLDLSRLRMRMDVARSYVETSAGSIDSGEEPDPCMGIYAKTTAGEVSWDMATAAVELHGGRGYMREEGVEKLLRDAASFAHAAGSDRTMLLRAAQLRFDEDVPATTWELT